MIRSVMIDNDEPEVGILMFVLAPDELKALSERRTVTENLTELLAYLPPGLSSLRICIGATRNARELEMVQTHLTKVAIDQGSPVNQDAPKKTQ